MKKIDFLPPRLREEHDRRKRIAWRCALLGCCALVASTGAFCKHRQRYAVELRLEESRRQYDAALASARKLGDLNGQLASLNAQAELLVYLRHSWPRSQVLAAVLPALPASIELSRLQVRREKAAPSHSGAALRDPVRRPAEGRPSEQPKRLPAESDLESLRQEIDATPTAVVLEGIADDTVALNRYLGELSDAPLIERAELESMESLPDDRRGRSSFRARLTLLPGYGQPHGPTPAALAVEGSSPTGGAP